ncbi:hypothetical protein DL766_008997 [Monosporascus sp. MC13-8B]|uniref:Sm domain-containing protein n=1 Tax=Monosporascus cannonballus TaxID=155416 RepID=A0ABY0H5X2_9PEZI|nr:hypothetical protein DL762_005066 [Monosporascus cannonballus]RYO96116.1 hypothetical protein DL763_003406 [Monosporascus cannonballus]RYP16997.1 hypothetical protein DL766_008997 [Monosporascus sp. MC13-8B]
MLPLGLLNAAQGHPMLVELKNGETLNGHLIQCDTWMNLTLKEVIQTSPEADKFVRLPEIYVKGNNTNSRTSRAPSGAGAAAMVKDVATTAEEEVIEEGVEDAVKAEGEAEAVVLEKAAIVKMLRQLGLRKEVRSRMTRDHHGGEGSYPYQSSDRGLCKEAEDVKSSSRYPALYHGTSTSDDGYVKKADRERAQYIKRVARRSPWVPEPLFHGPDVSTERLDKVPTRTIYEALRELQNVEDSYGSVVRLVEYLVAERGEQPNELLYECLIRANVDPKHGSAEVAGSLVKEMIGKGMQTSPRIYQALLEVTAVHPDYILRSLALLDMKNRWYSPNPDGLMSIIVGLLRDGQYELALEKLEELYKSPVTNPPWLYHIFIYVFGELGFHEESFQILQHQLKVYGPNQLMVIWSFLLDVYSRDAFYPGITYIWERMVTPGLLHPPDGTAVNVLNAASRHGDAALVTSVMRLLTDRGRRLDLHHYEALIDAHTLHHEVRKAFTVLCIMRRAGLAPDSSSTRPIYRMLRESPSATDEALSVLQELRQQYQVPIAAFNVVLEATVLHYGFKRAFDLYRAVRRICADDGPDLRTFHILLRRCVLRKSMNFLLDELQTFGVRPDREAYDQLIRICALQDDYEPAFKYLERMTRPSSGSVGETTAAGSGWWMSRASALALARRCVHAQDVRVRLIMDECRRRGMSIDADVRWLVERAQKEREQQQQQQEEEEGEGGKGEEATPRVQEPSALSRLVAAMSS